VPQNKDLLTFGYYAPEQWDKLVKGLGHRGRVFKGVTPAAKGLAEPPPAASGAIPLVPEQGVGGVDLLHPLLRILPDLRL
jgi:hypothetical protein